MDAGTPLDAEAAPPAPQRVSPPPPGWLFAVLTTAVLAVVLFVADIVVTVGGLVYLGYQEGLAHGPDAALARFLEMHTADLAHKMLSNGNVIACMSVAGLAVGWATAWLFSALKRQRLRDLLGIADPGGSALVVWTFISMVMAWLTGVFVGAMDEDNQWWVDAGRSAHPAWMVAGMVIAAPMLEEGVFRGWLFGPLSRSHLGTTATVLVTAAAWTALHSQYGFPMQAALFVDGVMLGVARARTGSMVTPLVMHVAWNLFSSLPFLLK